MNDYTRKSGVVHTEILLPENAPSEFADRSILWNAVEKIEKSKNSQLAREIEIALPRELTREQNIILVNEYVKLNFVDVGMCVDICIHDKNDGNPHAHILLTMRPFNEDKTWGAKQRKEYIFDERGEKIYDKNKRQYKCKSIPSTDWNEHNKAEEWRSAWANVCNKYLELANSEQRIDHRSFERQGKQEIPTIHLGSVAHKLEKKGIHTERGDRNREIEITNRKLRQIKRRITRLEKWLDKAVKADQAPTLANVITNILEQQGEYGLDKLKSAADMLVFLQENRIMNMDGLDEKLKDVIGDQLDIQRDFKQVENELKAIDKNIIQGEVYKENRKYKVEYNKLYAEYQTAKKSKAFGAKRKAQKALDTANEYHRKYSGEITSFETAKQHLKDVLKNRFDPKKLPPITKWKAEKTELLAEKTQLNDKYKKLKSDVDNVSRIRSNVDSILNSRWQIRVSQNEITNVISKTPTTEKQPTNMRERLAWAKKKADEQNAQRIQTPKLKAYKDRGGR